MVICMSTTAESLEGCAPSSVCLVSDVPWVCPCASTGIVCTSPVNRMAGKNSAAANLPLIRILPLLRSGLLWFQNKDFPAHRVPIELSMEVAPEMEQVIRGLGRDFKAETDRLPGIDPQSTGRVGVDQSGTTGKLEV